MKHWLVLLLIAFGFGATVAVSMGRTQGRTATPEGWGRQTRGQIFVSAAQLGKEPAAWNNWSISSYERLLSDKPANRLDFTLTLPEGGRLSALLGEQRQGQSPGLVLEAGKPPTGQIIRADSNRTDPRCSGVLSAIGTTPVQVSMWRTESGWSARVGSEEISCSTPVAGGGPALIAGLRRVTVGDIQLEGRSVGTPHGRAMGVGSAVLLLLMGLGWVERKMGFSWSAVNGSATPLVLALGGLGLDGAWIVETMRIAGAPGDLLFVWGAVALAVLAKICLGVAALARRVPDPIPTSLVYCAAPLALAGLGTASALGIQQQTGLVYSALGGAALGALVWVQVHAARVRLFNLVSLVLAFGVLGSLEVAVRFSTIGSLWNAVDTQQGAGSMQTLIQQFEDLKDAKPTMYPAAGFPVRVPPRTAPVRVVCLGASSTGGAYQNDNLNQFYPARLAEYLGSDVQVVNQGVGGWTSFHIRHFIDQHLNRLDADVLTVYLGVNEALPTPVPFDALYDMWKAGDLQATAGGTLDSVRLYQGIRLLARGLRPGGGAGVSPDSLYENLSAISDAANSRGIRLMIMSEGLRPDPAVLSDYWSEMEPVASQRPDTAYLDTARVLQRVGNNAFLDANHLSSTGHRAVARTMADELKRLDWIKARGQR